MYEILEAIITKAIKGSAEKPAITITVPERREFGHYSTHIALQLAKIEGKNPMILAGEIAVRMMEIDVKSKSSVIEKTEVARPGFINIWIKSQALHAELVEIVAKKARAAESKAGKGKRVIVEHSSLNVAKPMHVGHLRNAAIGDTLANCYSAAGYKVVRWNYLGDWGTQFGKLIVAYKRWGDKKEVLHDPIGALTAIYVRFHQEAKDYPELEDVARAEFKKLEQGDAKNRALWQWFKKESLEVFAKTNKRLGILFDTQIGESFFEKELTSVSAELVKKGIAIRSEGALIVPLDADSAALPPAMVEKSDGASTYLARDLANLRYRVKKYKPAKILYVVGNEQSLHLAQVFATGRLMGIYKNEELVHVKYGLVLGEGGTKFSTREGQVVSAEDVIEKAVTLARGVVEEKNHDLTEREKKAIAEAVALGALRYANIKENRNSDIVFDWKKMLDFSGESAPYLQYTYARLRSIERKAGVKKSESATSAAVRKSISLLTGDLPLALIRKLIELPRVTVRTAETYAPNMLALYLYELAALVNQFYETTPIMKDEDAPRRGAYLTLVGAVATSLKCGLALLGIQAPEKI